MAESCLFRGLSVDEGVLRSETNLNTGKTWGAQVKEIEVKTVIGRRPNFIRMWRVGTVEKGVPRKRS